MEAIIQLEQSLSPQQTENGRIPFKQLLNEYEYPQPERGDIIKGEILRIDEDALYVDIGAKRDAIVPYEEINQLDEELLNDLSTGDEVPVFVTRTPFGEEELWVSLERGLQQYDWERAEKLAAQAETIELLVIKQNKGGLIVEFGRLEGFVPNSHLPDIRHNHNSQLRQKYKAKKIGTTIPLKMIEVNPSQKRFVLSAMAAQKEQRQARLQALEEGDIITGKVVGLKEYGAFIDIGDGLKGLLHITNIMWDRLNHPADVLNVGDEIKVMVENVDLARERISLNRKLLLPVPWQKFAADYDIGDLIEGEVVAIVDFGAFIKISAGVEGLLHKNELYRPQDDAVEDILQVGDSVLVRIVSLDADKKRLGLSMRRVSATEEVAWMSANNAAMKGMA